MERATVVLVDATQYGADPELVRVIGQNFPLVRVSAKEELGPVYAAHDRVISCFEFDFPDIASLSRLSEAKQAFTSVPVLMFTQQHSEALAVWALRSRVWDYFVKPVQTDAFLDSLYRLEKLVGNARDRSERTTILKSQPLPEDARFRKLRYEDKVVEAAVAYIEQHLSDKLIQADIAEQCGSNSYQLSRAFKQAHGITFQEYIVRRRIQKATELLENNSASVMDVCWSVGFHDASHFTRMFQRYIGMPPSQYRQKCHARREAAADSPQLSLYQYLKV